MILNIRETPRGSAPTLLDGAIKWDVHTPRLVCATGDRVIRRTAPDVQEPSPVLLPGRQCAAVHLSLPQLKVRAVDIHRSRGHVTQSLGCEIAFNS